MVASEFRLAGTLVVNLDVVEALTRHLSVDQIGPDQRCPPALSSEGPTGSAAPRSQVPNICAMRRQERRTRFWIERQAFVRSKLDAKVLGQGSPTALAIEFSHPVDIRNVGRESVA